jgi:hypothetical protein
MLFVYVCINARVLVNNSMSKHDSSSEKAIRSEKNVIFRGTQLYSVGLRPRPQNLEKI